MFIIIHAHLLPQLLWALASGSRVCFRTHSSLESLADLLRVTPPLLPRLCPRPVSGHVWLERPSSLDLIQDDSEGLSHPQSPYRTQWVLSLWPHPASFPPSQMLIPRALPENFLHLLLPKGKLTHDKYIQVAEYLWKTNFKWMELPCTLYPASVIN